jgi:hypothetical protein
MSTQSSDTNRKKKIVFLTGACISAESGIKTFRDSGGLWEKYPVEDVATIEGYIRNPELVLRFYNERRRQLAYCQPNDGHLLVAALEKDYEVTVVTQNVDNLTKKPAAQTSSTCTASSRKPHRASSPTTRAAYALFLKEQTSASATRQPTARSYARSLYGSARACRSLKRQLWK